MMPEWPQHLTRRLPRLLPRLAQRITPLPDLPPPDVCLLVEGCYPFRGGGVSSWLDLLMRDQASTTFSLLSIQPRDYQHVQLYPRPPNLACMSVLELGASRTQPFRIRPFTARNPGLNPELLAGLLVDLATTGSRAGFERLIEAIRPLSPQAIRSLPASQTGWHTIQLMFEASAPGASFLQYYWAWQSLFGGLFDILACPIPSAGTYHSVSTGFAGLLAARAAIETGRPMLLTEHGIYANERTAEILTADWIVETLDVGLSEQDQRRQLRDIWIQTFAAFAKVAYDVAEEILTLYPANQAFQRELGAPAGKLRVIQNGLDTAAFERLIPAPPTARPTIALIGRGARIKDIGTFIRAVRTARADVPGLRALVLGSWQEDPDYLAHCSAQVERLDLEDCIEFVGRVDIHDWLPAIHVVVLTSLSEAQPFSLMEAGAAGIPCIATDVGDCRSMLLGSDDGTVDHDSGPGGIVVAPLDVDATAQAITRLLRDDELRARYGRSLRQRVRRVYRREVMREGYASLYLRHAG